MNYLKILSSFSFLIQNIMLFLPAFFFKIERASTAKILSQPSPVNFDWQESKLCQKKYIYISGLNVISLKNIPTTLR